MGLGIMSMPWVGVPTTRENIEPESSTGITSTIRNYGGKDAKAALIQNKAQNECQFTIDGTTPTTSATTDKGFVLGHNDSFLVIGKTAVINLRMLDRISGSKSKIEVVCFF